MIQLTVICYRKSLSNSFNEEKSRKARIAKIAAKAAKKHATPPPIIDDDDNDHDDLVIFFAKKVLPSALSPDECSRKLLEKYESEDACQLQINIVQKVKELNNVLINKKPTELFRDHSCSILYHQILDLQIAQSFASNGWKVVAFATLVPMIGRITLYTAPIFHTRKCSLFFSWSLGQKYHSDFQVSPVSNLFNDENVEQQIGHGLVGKPTRKIENENDWPLEENLENLNESSSSVESKSSSIDSGKTLVSPVIPIMDSSDITNLESFVESSNQDSYLDISFINVKRRLNLSKKEKIDILDGPSSVHSTPVRPKDNTLRPKLGSKMKKTSGSRLEKNLAGSSNQDQPGYISQFLNRWFKKQIANMTAEIELELKNQSDQKME